MLKELVEKLRKLTREKVPFDPSRFNDPITNKVEWIPARSGGANFKTHNLVQVNSSRMIFRSSIGARMFYLIFLLIGLGFAFGFPYLAFQDGTFELELTALFPVFFSH